MATGEASIDQVGCFVQTRGGENVTFDATTQSEHRMQAEITTNPIESNKGDVTDHRRVKPRVWSFTAVLVDEADPTKSVDRQTAARGNGFDQLQSARENGPQITRKALESLDLLKRVFDNSETVWVTTDVEKFDNAVLESLTYKVIASTPVSGFRSDATVIEISGTFRQIQFASTETVTVPKDVVKRRQGKKEQKATAAPETSSTQTKEKGETLLHRITGGL